MSIGDRIAALDALLAGTGVTGLELVTPEETIRVRRRADGAAPVAAPPAEAPAILAPCPGVVRLRHPLRAAPLVQAGQAVAAGEVVALMQVGLLLVPVAAPRAGTLGAVLVEDGAVVGYGTALVQVHEAEEP